MLVRHPFVVALGICALAAAAEGMLSGKRPMEVLATLRLPRFTPPRWAWIIIGVFYYVICFTVLTRLLLMDGSNRLQYSATVLMMVLLGLNAFFNYLLFRSRNVQAAFMVFIPYDLVAVALQICLFFVDNTAGFLFALYLAYLIFATVWGYQLWRLNEAKKNRIE
jgi:tryptophan-rich sensory protein